MTAGLAERLQAALAAGEPAVVVGIAGTRGSTPREAGATMLVMRAAQAGTIGGGALEWMALDRARRMLAEGTRSVDLEVPLGPEIGQCCGGHVAVSLRLADGAALATLRRREAAASRAAPAVLVFGAGHVGQALAAALAPLPLRTTLVDSRPEALAGLPEGVAARCSALPEAEVDAAPAEAAYVVLTHSHALDFLVAERALLRRDAAYVGMIGSDTKRVRFLRHLRQEGHAPDLAAPLVLPIGGTGLRDKRPAVIAALVAAEVATLLLGRSAARGAAAGASRAA